MGEKKICLEWFIDEFSGSYQNARPMRKYSKIHSKPFFMHGRLFFEIFVLSKKVEKIMIFRRQNRLVHISSKKKTFSLFHTESFIKSAWKQFFMIRRWFGHIFIFSKILMGLRTNYLLWVKRNRWSDLEMNLVVNTWFLLMYN